MIGDVISQIEQLIEWGTVNKETIYDNRQPKLERVLDKLSPEISFIPCSWTVNLYPWLCHSFSLTLSLYLFPLFLSHSHTYIHIRIYNRTQDQDFISSWKLYFSSDFYLYLKTFIKIHSILNQWWLFDILFAFFIPIIAVRVQTIFVHVVLPVTIVTS